MHLRVFDFGVAKTVFVFQKSFNLMGSIERNHQKERRKAWDSLLEVVGRKRLAYGVLIAIEGIDGAGKTTQSKILLNKLIESGYPAIRLHEPTEGKWGRKIKNLAKNGRHKTTPQTELSLFYLDRIEDVSKNIKPSLEKKRVIIMDRYYFSSVAYQSARGLSPNSIEEMNKKIAPVPDVTIIIDLDSEIGLKRIRHTRNMTPNHFERKRYLDRVRQVFLKQFDNRHNVHVIDGNRPIQIVASEIWKIVEPIIQKAEET